jgi:hypothetical protein
MGDGDYIEGWKWMEMFTIICLGARPPLISSGGEGRISSHLALYRMGPYIIMGRMGGWKRMDYILVD